MTLIQLKNISLSFAEEPLFDQLSLQIDAKQRIALIGRNGTGKSTLLKVLQQHIQPDSGTIESQANRITALQQDIPKTLEGSVHDFISQAYQPEDEWAGTHPIDRIITQLQLDPTAEMKRLSGGEVRRCLLAQALINEPDVLLLDEPTNHMDLEAIQWLERFLARSTLTCIIITHDRTFLQNVATRIIELDRGKLISWDGDYHSFLNHKEQQLAAEERANDLFDKRLAQEETWVRQGIKARRTRNEGRVRALKQMRRERSQRRQQGGSVQLQQHKNVAAGKLVCVADEISVSYDNNIIFDKFSCIIQRQDKIGIIGRNGCGKTTLIRCLLEQSKPDQGTVQLGTQLDIAYFDQHRAQLDENDTPMDAVAEGRTHITINGQSKHIIGYLQDFLFSPTKARSKIRTLSGGERNRLLLAKLFSQPANLLVLDEPTNDLDIETLELLESYLVEFTGTVIVVSHDRTFLNNVITNAYVFGDNGHITEYVGGYDDIPDQQEQTTPIKATTNTPEKSTSKKTATLTYEERRELNKLPNKIEKLEAKINTLQATIGQSDFYQQPQDQTEPVLTQLSKHETQLQTLYQRWEQLSQKE